MVLSREGYEAFVATGDFISLILAFHLDGAREQDVVFEVDVLVQVLLQLFYRAVERLIAHTGVGGRVEIIAQLPNSA